MEEITRKIIIWGEENGFDNPKKQFVKLIEEIIEAKEELARCELWKKIENSILDDENSDNYVFWINEYGSESIRLFNELGDIGIAWILLCNMFGFDPKKVLETAYEKNNNRTDKTTNVAFVKEDFRN